MLLGFISLLLTVGTSYIIKICIPTKLGETFLPCEDNNKKRYDKGGTGAGGDDRRKLLSYAEEIIWHRALASGDEKDDYCAARVRKLLYFNYLSVPLSFGISELDYKPSNSP